MRAPATFRDRNFAALALILGMLQYGPMVLQELSRRLIGFLIALAAGHAERRSDGAV